MHQRVSFLPRLDLPSSLMSCDAGPIEWYTSTLVPWRVTCSQAESKLNGPSPNPNIANDCHSDPIATRGEVSSTRQVCWSNLVAKSWWKQQFQWEFMCCIWLRILLTQSSWRKFYSETVAVMPWIALERNKGLNIEEKFPKMIIHASINTSKTATRVGATISGTSGAVTQRFAHNPSPGSLGIFGLEHCLTTYRGPNCHHSSVSSSWWRTSLERWTCSAYSSGPGDATMRILMVLSKSCPRPARAGCLIHCSTHPLSGLFRPGNSSLQTNTDARRYWYQTPL